jgi:cyclopropane-fatty-acyl-phospholipid synthase
MLAILRRWLELDSGEAADLVRRMFDAHPTKHFAVRLWDGTEVRWDRDPEFTIRFPDPDVFFDCVRSADPACFAEAYADDRLHIDGDLRRAVELASYLGQIHLGLREKLRVVPRLAVASSNHSRERDTRDVRAHYDLSDDFFRLFLDRRMVYSCAYFAHPDQTLEEAQERKLELVCRKLDLRPGEQYLDIGCGWGALPLWAAERHAVHAHGITLSPNQLAEARRRVAGAGLGDRVELALAHFGELPDDRFDKISSVGMIEHAGIASYPAYFGRAYRALRRGGLFLNHGITTGRNGHRSGGAFIWRNVFPGAELADVSLTQRAMEDAGLEILDVQSLRPHYELTLREWYQRFAEHRDEAARFVPARTLRIWDMYLLGCERAFAEGLVNVYQILAAKPDTSGRTRAPLTREQITLPS